MVSLWHHMMNFSPLLSQLLRSPGLLWDWDSSVEAQKVCLGGWFKTLYLPVENPRKGQRPMLRTTQAGVSGAAQWVHSCGIWGHSAVLPADVLRGLPPLIPTPALLYILSNNFTSCLGEELENMSIKVTNAKKQGKGGVKGREPKRASSVHCGTVDRGLGLQLAKCIRLIQVRSPAPHLQNPPVKIS